MTSTTPGPELVNDIDELDTIAETPPAPESTEAPASSSPTPPAALIDDDAVALEAVEDNAAQSDEASEEVAASDPIAEDEPTSETSVPLTPEEQREVAELKALADQVRARQGVPTSPDRYTIPEVQGYTFDRGAPLVKELFDVAHKNGIPDRAVSTLMGWFGGKLGGLTAVLAQKDAKDYASTAPALRREWGDSYNTNVSLMRTLIRDEKVVPVDARKAIESARLPDGRRLINDPAFLRYLAMSARGQVANPQTAAQLRKAEIAKVRDTDINEYFRQGLDKEMIEIETKPATRPTASSPDATRARYIERIMKTDIDRYYREGLDTEYTAILARRGR